MIRKRASLVFLEHDGGKSETMPNPMSIESKGPFWRRR